jgi:predicted nucleic-acid-binding Zn-ribbon protein
MKRMKELEKPEEHCKCPMCGQNQYNNGEITMDDPAILRVAYNALVQYVSTIKVVKKKSELFDELIVAYRKKFAINDNPVSLMVLVDKFAEKSK